MFTFIPAQDRDNEEKRAILRNGPAAGEADVVAMYKSGCAYGSAVAQYIERPSRVTVMWCKETLESASRMTDMEIDHLRVEWTERNVPLYEAACKERKIARYWLGRTCSAFIRGSTTAARN